MLLLSLALLALATAQPLPLPVVARRALARAAAPPAPDCARHPARTPIACGCDKRTAPARYNLTLATTAGPFTVQVQRSDAPIGADRLYAMSACGDYLGASSERGNEGSFFRVVPGFVVQWGISGVPAVSQAWENLVIPNEDPSGASRLSNVRGTLAFAAEQDASGFATNRTTQVYVNYGDNSRLDKLGFSVIGVISEVDMKVVDALVAKWGQEPDQDAIYQLGNSYLAKSFPGLSYTNATHLAV